MSPDALIPLMRASDRLMWSQGAAEPLAFIEPLIARRNEIGCFGIFVAGSYSSALGVEAARDLRIMGMGAVGANRALCAASLMDVVPCHLSHLPQILASRTLPVDVVILQIAPALGGRHSFGAVSPFARHAMAAARLRIAEINVNAPRVRSSDQLSLSEFDHVYESDRPLVEIPRPEITGQDRTIATRVAEFIGDDAVLQIGIGALPEAVLTCLTGRRRLGLHSGVIGDGLLPLIECGALDNASKTLDRGVSVTAGLAGSRQLYKFADMNDTLAVEPVIYTHAASTLGRLKGLVAINSAIEVDLTGQFGSEVAGGRYLGTIGGQIDFVRGAMAAPGGRSVIALPSRTAKGISRIVPVIASGAVTGGRADADIVVTEFGAAELRGKGIAERVRRMIAIAHPDDRESLDRVARKLVVGATAG